MIAVPNLTESSLLKSIDEARRRGRRRRQGETYCEVFRRGWETFWWRFCSTIDLVHPARRFDARISHRNWTIRCCERHPQRARRRRFCFATAQDFFEHKIRVNTAHGFSLEWTDSSFFWIIRTVYLNKDNKDLNAELFLYWLPNSFGKRMLQFQTNTDESTCWMEEKWASSLHAVE